MKLYPILRAVLRPLSLVYAGGSRARVWLYRRHFFRQYRLPQIVVSIGNLTVGGTGKTPMVLWITQRLLEGGKRVGILTRGYAGFGKSKRKGKPELSDEVRLLQARTAGKVPIGAGANRRAEAMRIEKEDVEWLVLDDGFQHLELARDVDIVLIDATNPFGGGLLPAGRLREPLPALARADILVITRSTAAPAIEEQLRRYSTSPIFYAQTHLQQILPVPNARGSEKQLIAPGKTKFFTFCGVGNPAGFWSDLNKRWGFHLVGARAFRDHHAYTTYELRKLERQAQAAGAEALICTEKDVFNLPANTFETLPAYYCRIEIRLSDPEGFWRAILASVKRRHGGAR